MKIIKLFGIAALIAILIFGAYLGYDHLKKNNNSPKTEIDLSKSEENVGISYETQNETANSPSVNETKNHESNNELKGDYADFTVYTEDGEKTRLSDIVAKGKPVIINFWTTWCGYCKMEMPDFDEAYKEYQNEIEFMMIDICGGGQDDINKAMAYVEQEQFSFPVYYDKDLSALYAYYTTGYPTTIVLNAEANVVYAQSGALSKQALESIIDQLI